MPHFSIPKNDNPNPWNLNLRQKLFLSMQCNLYVPVMEGSVGKRITGVNYLDSPTYMNVPCYFDSTPEVDIPAGLGRSKEVNIFTLDKLIFPISVPIMDTWGIVFTDPKLLLPSEKKQGFAFLICLGNPISRISTVDRRRRTDFQKVYMKRTPPPTNLEAFYQTS